MRKFVAGLVLAAMSLLFPVDILAAGGVSVSTTALTVEVGSTGAFMIVATNATGDVAIASSDSNVARVSANEWGTGMVEEGQTKSGTITVTGVNEGTATITLTVDAATFDGEDLAGQTRTVTVNVTKKVETPAETNNGGAYESVVNNNVDANNVSGDVGDRNGGEQDGSESVDANNEGDVGDEDKSAEEKSLATKQNNNQSSKSRGSDKAKENDESGGGIWWVVAVAAVVVAVLGVAVWIFVKKKGSARRF